MSRWALETRSDFLDEAASSRWEMSASRFERQRLGIRISGLLAMFFEVDWGFGGCVGFCGMGLTGQVQLLLRVLGSRSMIVVDEVGRGDSNL